MSKNETPYRVECRPAAQHFFEVIAAFNCESAALAYATECQVTNEPYDYRVTIHKRSKGVFGTVVLHDHVYVTGAAILQKHLGKAA